MKCKRPSYTTLDNDVFLVCTPLLTKKEVLAIRKKSTGDDREKSNSNGREKIKKNHAILRNKNMKKVWGPNFFSPEVIYFGLT